MPQHTSCPSIPRRLLVTLALVAALLTAALPAAPAAATPSRDGAGAEPAARVSATHVWSLSSLWQGLVERIFEPTPATAPATVTQQAAPSGADPLRIAASNDGSNDNGPSLDPSGLK